MSQILPAAHSFLGFLALALLAWVLGGARRDLAWRTVAGGLALQVVLAATLLWLPGMQAVFVWLNDALRVLERATTAGTGFVFGYLGGGPAPFEITDPSSSFILAFRALPLVLVVSALSALLFYWRILPVVVRAFAWLLERSLQVSGVVGVGSAANVFVGMVEAPLLVRPYLARATRSELFMIMVSGMATIAGTVMVLYASILGGVIDGAMGHILAASLISAPAAITIAALWLPAEGASSATVELENEDSSSMEALTRGTLQGLQLLLAIIAMLVVFVALVALVDAGLGLMPPVAGEPFSLARIFGWLFAPLAWLMGIPWAEAVIGGSLLGTKVVLNELLAYLALAELPQGALSPRSALILLYALCGFANFGSLGILLGGLCTLVPERRGEIVALGMRSVFAGLLATCMTGALVGALVWDAAGP